MKRRTRAALHSLGLGLGLCSLLASSSGCLQTTSEDTFLGNASENPCKGVFLQCMGQPAGCLLGEDEYIGGQFPGMRRFLVETSRGDWKIRLRLFLAERIWPGVETEVHWYEPGCTDEYRYRLSENRAGGDLFEQAGKDQVFEIEHSVVEPGDHLVTITSDATCRFDLRVNVVKQ